MSELNVSLVLRLVDRLTRPARAASAALGSISKVQVGMVKQATALTAATTRLAAADAGISKAADAAAAATTAQARAVDVASASVERLTTAARTATEGLSSNARAAVLVGSETAAAGDAAEVATRRFGGLERMQLRGRAASRMLGGELGRLNDRIGRLAMASIATEGMSRAGRAIMGPITNSVERAAAFQKGMAGIGILADLSPAQLAPVQSNILASAQRLAIPVAMMQQDDMAVLNEGVYRGPKALVQASQSAARLSLLAEMSGAPISGPEAGALIATYAHSMQAPASMLDRLNATVFRASQIGGDKIGDVARFLPEIMGQMKARAFGNYQGFVDANAALQIAKRVTGSDESAGTDVRDLMQNLNHMLTDRRFKKMGLDLEAIIAQANKAGVSPLTASIDAIVSKIGSSPTDPGLAGKLGKFFQNAQAATAALAIITNRRDTSAGPGYDTFRREIADPGNVAGLNSNIQRASTGPYADLVRMQNAQDQIAISTGTILFPALNKLASVLTRVANLVSTVEKRGGFLAKAAVYAASGVGVLTLGAGALGNAVVGVVAPVMIARSLFRLLPLATKVAEGGLASLATRYGVAMVVSRALNGGVLTLATRALPALAAAARVATLAVLSNPLTWPIVAGIAAVGATALVVRKYWQPISAFFKGVWAGIGEGLRPVQHQLAGVGRAASAMVAPLRPA